MKRLLGLTLVAVLISTNLGCCLIDRMFTARRHYPICPNGACGARDCDACARLDARRAARRGAYATSPTPGGTVAYPYYTNRGPRDFFASQPSDIGP